MLSVALSFSIVPWPQKKTRDCKTSGAVSFGFSYHAGRRVRPSIDRRYDKVFPIPSTTYIHPPLPFLVQFLVMSTWTSVSVRYSG